MECMYFHLSVYEHQVFDIEHFCHTASMYGAKNQQFNFLA